MPRALLAPLALALCVSACGGALPTRFVVERDVGPLLYRRYQHVLDVEFPIEGNAAEGHTATYVRRGRGDDVDFATVFVAVYEHPASITAEVAESLRSLEVYETSVVDAGGAYAWKMRGPDDDRWLVWVSANRVVKIGGARGEDPEPTLVSTYLGMYPSDLDARGRAREGTLSVGPSARQATREREDEALPQSLREGAPQ